MQSVYPFRYRPSFNKLLQPTQIICRGMGQIMFQNNGITGALFFLGVSFSSIIMASAMFIATVIGTSTAVLLKYDPKEIRQGLYGFSPALVGAALILFFRPSVSVWLAISAGAIAASVLQHFFIKRDIPVFTFPFVLVTWLLVFFIKRYDLAATSVLLTWPYDTGITAGFIPRAYGQVIFQGSIVAGIIFFIGVIIHSQVAAIFGLLGGIIAAGIAFILGQDNTTIAMGLFGFNAVLCAIAFAGTKAIDVLWALASVVLSTIISIVMIRYQLIQLTFPFVAASCLLTYVKRKCSRDGA